MRDWRGARWRELPLSRALVHGTESALVYGAAANLLSFAVPLLHRPTDASLPFAVLAQVLVLATVWGVIALIAGGLTLVQRTGQRADGRASRAVAPSTIGPAGLAVLGLFMGYRLHERALMEAGIAVMALLVTVEGVRRTWPHRRVGSACVNWVTGGLLATVPFLAQPRDARGWPPTVATNAAIAVVVISFAVVVAGRRRAGPWRSSYWARGAAITAICLAGLLPGWLARETERPLTIDHAAAVPSARPNVVLITLDTVRADHLSVYGYARNTTPNLRDFWQRGATRYTRAFSTSDMTLSSHASIFTGLLPSDHGAHRRGKAPDTGLRRSTDTLAAQLRRAGFATVGLAANAAYLSGRFGFDAGFDYYDARRPLRLTAPFPRYFFGGTFVDLLLAYAGPDAQFSYRAAADMTREARQLLRPLKEGGRPFFLFLNLMDAHAPVVPPASYRRAFGVSDHGFYWLEDHEQLVKEVNAGTRTITAQEHAHLIASYDAAIASMDAELGGFFAELTRLGLFEDSLIIVTADHGELFGRSGAMGHDGIGIAPGLYQVPLLVKYPKVHESADSTRPVSAIDLYPTVLDLCQIPRGRDGEGRSLLAPSVPFDRPVFLESFENAWLAALHPRFNGDERAALVGDRLVIAQRTGATLTESWTDGRLPFATGASTPSLNLDHVYSVLHQLKADAAMDGDRRAPDRGAFDRLRSLGYVLR